DLDTARRHLTRAVQVLQEAAEANPPEVAGVRKDVTLALQQAIEHLSSQPMPDWKAVGRAFHRVPEVSRRRGHISMSLTPGNRRRRQPEPDWEAKLDDYRRKLALIDKSQEPVRYAEILVAIGSHLMGHPEPDRGAALAAYREALSLVCETESPLRA